jgi:hypothetical protein
VEAKVWGLQLTETKRLKALEEENRQLKRIVADQALKLQVVKGSAGKAVVTPEHRRTAGTLAMTTATISERRACRFTDFLRAGQRYRTIRPARSELRARLAVRHCGHTIAQLPKFEANTSGHDRSSFAVRP